MAEKAEATFKITIDSNAAEAGRSIGASARAAAATVGDLETEIKNLTGDMRRLRGSSDDVKAAKEAMKKRLDEARTSVSALTLEIKKQDTTLAEATAAAKKYGTAMSPRELLKGAGADVGKALAGLGSSAAKKLGPARDAVARGLAPAKASLVKAFGPAAKAVGDAASKVGGAAKARMATVGAGVSKALEAPLLRGLGKTFQAMGLGAKNLGGGALKGLATNALPLLKGAALAASAALAAVAVATVAAGAAVLAWGIKSADAAQKANRQRQAILGNAEDAKRLGNQIDELATKVPMGTAEIGALGNELSKTRLSGKAIVSTLEAVAQASSAIDASAGAKLQEIITRGQQTGRVGIGLRELQGTGIDFEEVAAEYAAGTKKSIEAARKELLMGAAPLEDAADAIKRTTQKKFGELNKKNALSLDSAPTKFLERFASLAKGINLEPITKGLSDAFDQLSPERPLGAAVKTFFEVVGGGFASVAGKSIPAILEGFKYLLVGALNVASYFIEMKNRITKAFEKGDYVALGKEIVKGLLDGLSGSVPLAIKAVKGLAGAVKDAFKDSLQIHSPSKVFAEFGEHTTAGYAQGIERGSGDAQGAVDAMITVPKAGATGAAAAGGVTVQRIEVNIHGAPTQSAQAMAAPDFMSQLTRSITDALAVKGLVAA